MFTALLASLVVARCNVIHAQRRFQKSVSKSVSFNCVITYEYTLFLFVWFLIIVYRFMIIILLYYFLRSFTARYSLHLTLAMLYSHPPS